MKILHVIASLNTGGAEHLMVDLLPSLRELGNEVELLLFDGKQTPFYEQLESFGIKIYHFGEGGSPYGICNLFRLRPFLTKYDIVHTHTTPCQVFAPIAGWLLTKKAKLVTTEHSTNNRRRSKRWLKLLDIWIYRHYDAIVAVTEQCKQNLLSYLNCRIDVDVINNGIDCSKFFAPIRTVSEHGTKIVTMVASMRDAKDQDTVIRAISILPEEYRLRLVGDGPRRNLLEALARSEGVAHRVEFLGNRLDVPELLQESDVIVLSSHWEGFGLSAVEGMAAGKPVVASDVPGLNNVVGESGLLFEQGNSSQLAMEILKLCDDVGHYINVAYRCQQNATKFDVLVTAQKYNDLYKRILKSKLSSLHTDNVTFPK